MKSKGRKKQRQRRDKIEEKNKSMQARKVQEEMDCEILTRAKAKNKDKCNPPIKENI